MPTRVRCGRRPTPGTLRVVDGFVWRGRTRVELHTEASSSSRRRLATLRWRCSAGGRVKFEVWAKEWRAGVVHLAPSTLAGQDRYMATHLIPAFKGVSLAQIDHSMVRKWVAGLSADGLAPATVRKAAGLMHRVMATAVSAGLIASSPCDGIKMPTNEHRVMRFIEPTQIADLVDAMDKRYRAFLPVRRL